MKRKNRLFWLVALVVASMVLIVGCQSQGQSEKGGEDTNHTGGKADEIHFNIGTAGTGGALYPMGVAIAETINKHSDRFKASAISTNASVQNIRELSENKQGMGIAQNEVAYFAYHGEDRYEGNEVTSLRGLFGTINSWVLVIVPADSDIQSIADFEGKRIGVGAPGSGGEIAAQRILKYAGLTYDDVQEEFLSDGEMAEGLKDGMLDAMIITNPLNSATMQDLSTSMDIRIIPLEEASFYETYPYYVQAEIPAGTYPGQDEPVTTAITRVLMLADINGPFTKEDVTELLEIIWDNESEWLDSHAAVKADTSFENALEAMTIPLHEGAVEFYQSRGVEVPEELIPPEMK